MSLPLELFPLDRAFLLDREAALCELLRPFLAFREHSLYFPDAPLVETRLLAAERRVLAPVRWRGKVVAALRFSGVQPLDARAVSPFLADIIALCLQNVVIAEAAKMDGETGLASEDVFWEMLTDLIARHEDANGRARNVCFGLIILQWPDAGKRSGQVWLWRQREAWRKMAEAMRAILPAGAVAASSGANEWLREFAICMPAFGRGGCHALARRVMAALADVNVVDSFSAGAVPLFFSAGHVLFPHDLQGQDLRRPAREQALILRDRARLAARAAARRPKRPVLAFAWLLRRGGAVLEVLPHNCLRISLGRASYARPGMRFYVFGPDGKGCKAQIVIRLAREEDAEAEVFHAEAGAAPPEPGDRLVLFPRAVANDGEMLDHMPFFEKFGQMRKNWRSFVLSISRFKASGNYRAAAKEFAGILKKRVAESIAKDGGEAEEPVAGFYGVDGVVVFWPGWGRFAAETELRAAHGEFMEGGQDLASGIFAYPCLNFSKAESEACALKALEYAELLPAPHVGGIDDLALTISGDKRVSMGDELGAMEDYRKALLIKPDNALTLNSLAVCLAAMSKPREAVELLEKALAAGPDAALRAKICYNLANIYYKQANAEETAIAYCRQCIRADKSHAWAWLRLGQIYAGRGKPQAARAMFRHAARLAGADVKLAGIARRQLARLAAAGDNTEDARNILHDSLLINPADREALLQLAQAYVEDDPVVAETLARKCLRLGAGGAFAVLADALAKQGRHAESEEARRELR